MDLSLQSLLVAPWQLQRSTRVGPLSCSSSQLGLLARKSQLRGVRCSVAEGEGETAQEKPAAKAAASGSWLQADAGADPFFGWSSDGSQINGSSTAGWIKIGGVVVLATGFALGARTLYTRKDATRDFAVLPPATEHTVSPSKVSESAGVQDNLDGSRDMIYSPNSHQGGFVKQEMEPDIDGAMPYVQHQEKSTPGQVSLLSEDVEDYTEKEDNFNVSFAATVPTSKENLEHNKGFSEFSAADTTLLPPSEDVMEKGSVLSDSGVSILDGSRVATEAPEEDSTSPVVSEIDDTNGMDITQVVDLSPLSGVSSEGDDVRETHYEPDVLNVDRIEPANQGKSGVSAEGDDVRETHYEPDVLNVDRIEPANQENLPPLRDATILAEPCLPEFPLHDDDGDESVQSVAFGLEDFSSSSKKNGLEKMSSQHDQWDERNSDVEPFASAVESARWFSSPGITAPSAPSAGLPKTLGRVVVPASVDHMQEQVLAALQALKVIEAGVEPGGICTRREYARWLIASTATLSRSPAHKVFPAMYIENASKLAYDDVLPEDPDFPFIQGLAEAGLISSRLLGNDIQHDESKVLDGSDDAIFSPDSPLTRQDLITWKVAVERKPAHLAGFPSPAGNEALQEASGFIDIDKIHQDAWPALLADINAGERSIIALAFGYTRRFQPEKPVTKAQAAVALATSEAWELVSEELARLEAESIAEAAVAAELALETKAQQEVAAAFHELLQVEREKQQAAASLVEATRAELEQLKADREEEKYALLKEQAVLDSEKEFLSNLRHEVEEQALTLSSAKLEVAFEKEQADKLHAEAKEERATISKLRSELEIEKNALTLARAWAEDEARQALAHSKVLEQVRKRWESEGVQVHVDKELDEVNIPGPSWHYREGLQVQKTPMDELITKSRDLGRMFVDAVVRFFQFIQLVFHAIMQRSTVLVGGLGEKFHEARIKCVDATTKSVEGIKQTVPSSVVGMTSSIREGTLKAVDGWKGGAERLVQKLKIS